MFQFFQMNSHFLLKTIRILACIKLLLWRSGNFKIQFSTGKIQMKMMTRSSHKVKQSLLSLTEPFFSDWTWTIASSTARECRSNINQSKYKRLLFHSNRQHGTIFEFAVKAIVACYTSGGTINDASSCHIRIMTMKNPR